MVGVVMDGRRPGSGSFGIKRTLPDFILDIEYDLLPCND